MYLALYFPTSLSSKKTTKLALLLEKKSLIGTIVLLKHLRVCVYMHAAACVQLCQSATF